MAAPRNRRPGGLVTDIPECPVCLEMLTAPIFSCESGHDLCGSCTNNLRPYTCPICRAKMTHTRNEGLEQAIKAALVQCPNNKAGCIYTLPSKNVEAHLKECTYRQYSCPLGPSSGFGNCLWNGLRSDMLSHFKDCHRQHCNDVYPDWDIELNHVSLTENNGHLYLVNLEKLLFTINLKFNPEQGLAYLAVQHVGTKKVAQQYNYTIEIKSKQEPLRKLVLTEICCNDTVPFAEVISQGKCGVVSLGALNQFIKDHKLTFRYYITKQNEQPKRFDKTEPKDNNQNPANSRPKGPFPKGPRSDSKGPEPKGSDYKGPQNKGSGYKGPMKNKKMQKA